MRTLIILTFLITTNAYAFKDNHEYRDFIITANHIMEHAEVRCYDNINSGFYTCKLVPLSISTEKAYEHDFNWLKDNIERFNQENRAKLPHIQEMELLDKDGN